MIDEKLRLTKLNNNVKSILNLNLTEKCNKRCKYCFNISFKKSFYNKKLSQLIEFRDDNNIEEVQFYGGEPGMLSKEELQLVFDEVCKIKSCKYITIYTNGMFFRRYSLNDFKYNKEIISIIHITSLNDYKSINNIKCNFIRYLIILNDESDFILLENILMKENINNFYITFPCNFNELSFPNINFYNSWNKIKTYNNFKYMNNMDQIEPKIFKQLLKNNSYEKFKRYLHINKKINNILGYKTFTNNKIFINLCED